MVIDSISMGNKIKLLVKCINDITWGEIDEVIQSCDRDSALGPLVNPSKWTQEVFDANHKTKKVMVALKEFKNKVHGIGNFL